MSEAHGEEGYPWTCELAEDSSVALDGIGPLDLVKEEVLSSRF